MAIFAFTSPQSAARTRMPAGTYAGGLGAPVADARDFGSAGEVCALLPTGLFTERANGFANALPIVHDDVDATGLPAWSPPV